MFGEPAKLNDESHPDWAPTIDMGHNSSIIKQTSKPSSLTRHKRWEDRSVTGRRLCLEETEVDCNDNQENTNPALLPQNEPEMAKLFRIFDKLDKYYKTHLALDLNLSNA